MLRYKKLIWLLAMYVATQLLALFSGATFLFFAYILLYLLSLIYAVSRAIRAVKMENRLRPVVHLLFLFFIANALLTAVYVPALLYNPDINWRLRGEHEVDPMLLQVYVPLLLFVLAFALVGIAGLIARVVAAHQLKTRSS